MKANEAPEKIYVSNHSSELTYNWHNKRLAANDIEYTRTDAFIEKACDYLQKNLWKVVYENADFRQRFVTDFKNYMKGE